MLVPLGLAACFSFIVLVVKTGPAGLLPGWASLLVYQHPKEKPLPKWKEVALFFRTGTA
jgi:hypothetical protein